MKVEKRGYKDMGPSSFTVPFLQHSLDGGIWYLGLRRLLMSTVRPIGSLPRPKDSSSASNVWPSTWIHEVCGI